MVNTSNNITIKRGEIWWADLGDVVGSEQGGLRPVVIIQNDVGNKYSPTTIVAPVTTRTKKRMKTHVELDSKESGLPMRSTVLLEQPRTLDKSRLMSRVGKVNMDSIDDAMMISFGIMFSETRRKPANTYV